ncbi:MAG: hypothetical protein AB7F51_17130 [Pseudorhodoplanes sp.]
MSSSDDDKLLAKLAELRKRRASVEGAAGTGAANPSGGDRGARLRALREKRQAMKGADGADTSEAPGGGQSGPLLRRLMARRAAGGGGAAGQDEAAGGNRAAVLRRLMQNKPERAGAADGGEKGRGDFIRRVMARRKEQDAGGMPAAGSGDAALTRLLMRRLGSEGGTPEERQKAREKIENLIQELNGRLKQIEGDASATPSASAAEPVVARASGKSVEPKGSKRGGTAPK